MRQAFTCRKATCWAFTFASIMKWGISLIRYVLVFLLSSRRYYKYGVESDKGVTTSGIMDKLKGLNRNIWMEMLDFKFVTVASFFNIVPRRQIRSKYIPSLFLAFGTTWGLMLAPGSGLLSPFEVPCTHLDRSPSKTHSLSESCVETILFTCVTLCIFISEWPIYRRCQ
jgi:hypothetical protein